MTIRKRERVLKLADTVAQRKFLHIRDAAALLDVSEMTVRRDVGENPDLFGYVGGHIVQAADVEGESTYELAKAADSHATAKREACAAAAAMIRPEDTIFIDCGTTLDHLVDFIPDTLPVTAICYALNIAEKLSRKPEIRLVMLGGVYHPASASFSGPAGMATLRSLGINVAFLSAAGVDFERGATCMHFHEAEIKRQVLAQAKKRVLVFDSSKIGKLKPAFFGELSRFDVLVTEAGPMSVPS
ncbi:DeoR family transcriptional regulator [Ensifer soli]|uniref:DeoR family transcriptional regulator n=1 Tax=Ciceribacter sp. sgz301302 TaxID=3342379 RepID=UPI0035BAC568